jgi:hypothetical protein
VALLFYPQVHSALESAISLALSSPLPPAAAASSPSPAFSSLAAAQASLQLLWNGSLSGNSGGGGSGLGDKQEQGTQQEGGEGKENVEKRSSSSSGGSGGGGLSLLSRTAALASDLSALAPFFLTPAPAPSTQARSYASLLQQLGTKAAAAGLLETTDKGLSKQRIAPAVAQEVASGTRSGKKAGRAGMEEEAEEAAAAARAMCSLWAHACALHVAHVTTGTRVGAWATEHGQLLQRGVRAEVSKQIPVSFPSSFSISYGWFCPRYTFDPSFFTGSGPLRRVPGRMRGPAPDPHLVRTIALLYYSTVHCISTLGASFFCTACKSYLFHFVFPLLYCF